MTVQLVQYANSGLRIILFRNTWLNIYNLIKYLHQKNKDMKQRKLLYNSEGYDFKTCLIILLTHIVLYIEFTIAYVNFSTIGNIKS